MGTTAFIAMGSNLRHGSHGAPRAVLSAAVQALSAYPAITKVICSDAFRSQPLGPPQPSYVNAVCRLETSLTATGMLQLLQSIERDFGRKRARRWGARVLDLDLIGFGDLHLKQPQLVVPHPRAHLRPFVLIPMAQVAPTWRHPVLQRTAAQLAAKLGGKRTVQRLGRLLLYIPPSAR
jgi:2-amino-4-hydroxy-6-hydroxymethyldihydropteridine diphosphokinase